MIDQTIFEEFCTRVCQRLDSIEKRESLSEDTIRYDFFTVLAKRIDPAELWLEYPHPVIRGKKIDTFVNSTTKTYLEFKYFRRLKAKKNADRTEQAAALISDFLRLESLDDSAARFSILVTDDEMLRYLGNPENGLAGLTTGKNPVTIDINRKSDHFRATVSKRTSLEEKSPKNVTVTPIYSSDCHGCRVIVFRVRG